MNTLPEILTVRRNLNNYPDIYEDSRIKDVSPLTRSQIAKDALKLYIKSREVVASVFVGFADHLLREAVKRQIVCVARDGLAIYIAAKNLKTRFDYPNKEESQLQYAYLSRSIVNKTEPVALEAYLLQFGVDKKDDVILADLGWAGSHVQKIKEVLPNADIRYLVSSTPEVAGYAHGDNNQMKAFENTINNIKQGRAMPDNPPVFFPEDTYSGPIKSPESLLNQGGDLVPDSIDTSYPFDVAIKRYYALLGIQDYIKTLNNPPEQPCQEAIDTLDDFLINQDLYADIMVPHE